MPFPIDKKLVVGVSSTALFDLSEEAEIYKTRGIAAFLEVQEERKNIAPSIGAAYPFIRRLLHLNSVFSEQLPVEVILLSRNHPIAGQRIMNAIEQHGLGITRAFFRSGLDPYPYMRAINCCLYLSTNSDEVKRAISEGYPAGHALPFKGMSSDDEDMQLRIAFDFDGVIVDDEAESVYKDKGLPLFHHYENENSANALRQGPLMPLISRLSEIQALERSRPSNSGHQAVRIAIVTARNAPAHKRLFTTMNEFGLTPDETCFLGGIEKTEVLSVFKPNIFFDDQTIHTEPASKVVPSVHIPFGVRNQ